MIICFGKKELFIHEKLIVLPSHCSASKTVIQSTKGCRAGFEIVQHIWTCLKDWILPDSLRTGNLFQVNSDNLLVNRRMKSLAQLIQEWLGPRIDSEFQVLPIFPQRGMAPAWLPFKLPQQKATHPFTTAHPLFFLSQTGETDPWCTADCSVYERGQGATYGQCVKIHTAPAVAAKNVLRLSVHAGIK